MTAQEDLPGSQERRRTRARKDAPALLMGLFIPVLVASLIFSRGEPLPGMLALLLGALVAGLLLNPATGARLRQSLSTREAQSAAAMVVPAAFLSGIFGGPVMLLVVLLLALAALLVAAFRGGAVLPSAEASAPLDDLATPAPATAPAALPAQAGGERVSEIDLRALCRGLPSALAGEVIATVEHLELVEVQARERGDARRSFDAAAGLRDYLPNTLRAWKSQPEDQRDPQELARALEQVRRIAGADEPGRAAARQDWETQKRFLEERAGDKDLR